MSPDPRRASRLALLAAAVLCLLPLTACYRQQMGDEGRVQPYEPSSVFPDGRSARPRVPDTVARGQLQQDALVAAAAAGGPPPFPLTLALLQRGRERFDVFCSPCHGRLGTGNGMIVQRGCRVPPSYLEPRLLDKPPAYFFGIIDKGKGIMPSYAGQVPPADRWAIATYIKALQLSQSATLADVPPAERQRLEAAK